MYQQGRGVVNIASIQPPVVAIVDEVMAAACLKETWFELNDSPRFRVRAHRLKVSSSPMEIPQMGTTVSFCGECDALLETVSGEVVLVKYVLTETSDALLRSQRELAALTYALEHPEVLEGQPPARISRHILLGFAAMPTQRNEKVYVPVRWTEIEHRPAAFQSFMRVVARILTTPAVPPPSPKCPRCNPRRPSAREE